MARQNKKHFQTQSISPSPRTLPFPVSITGYIIYYFFCKGGVEKEAILASIALSDSNTRAEEVPMALLNLRCSLISSVANRQSKDPSNKLRLQGCKRE